LLLLPCPFFFQLLGRGPGSVSHLLRPSFKRPFQNTEGPERRQI
jgi:hypothetical protein